MKRQFYCLMECSIYNFAFPNQIKLKFSILSSIMSSLELETLQLNFEKHSHKNPLEDKVMKGNYVKENTPNKLAPQSDKNFLTIMDLHPAARLINTPNIKREEYKKFVHLLYYGLTYCVKNLKGPSEEYLKRKSVTLPEDIPLLLNQPKRKFLMLDLDQTLIHSVFDANLPADVKFTAQGNEFRFNVRPYCLQFLENLSQYYDIYAFTASTKDYAQPIVEYLNKKKRTIQGILHRKNCLQTVNGFKIKDLRIIKNRGLEDIVLVDNLVHSFGLQLDNGIPILEFISNKQDQELIFLEKQLMEAKQYQDVREYIREKVNIKSSLEYEEKDFLNLNEKKWILERETRGEFGEIQIKKDKSTSKNNKNGLKNLFLCNA